MLTSTDPLGRVTSMAYNAKGQMTSMTDARGKVSTFEFNVQGDLVKATDPLGKFVTYEYDLSGRLNKTTDALGNSTTYGYNTARQLDKVTDPLGGQTTRTFDSRRNVASIANALGNVVESYQYDQRNRLTQTTDANGLTTRIDYDAAGLVNRITDRANRLTTFIRDEKNRLTSINRSNGQNTSMQYDAFQRVARIDGALSSHTYRYDSVDRLIEQTTTANGRTDTISYQYDSLDRLKTRTVNGADITSYTYDNASRLTRVDYRGQSTIYDYDEVSRLTKKTLPNGIVQAYAYDDASRVTNITYKKADNVTVIEQIDYEYDARGSRTKRSTLSNPTNAPQETPYAASYDVADRMTAITLKGTGANNTDETYNLTYDNLGNLTQKSKVENSDVTNYSWDTRNQLIVIAKIGTNATAATFKYDELGRRIERTVNGDTTRFVYDGSQTVLEIRNTETASILTGLGIDEVIARYTAGGTRTYLADALGSVIAMGKEDQSIVTQYGYSPYGETNQTNQPGETSSNANQYTSRENDNVGLYFYRARYYDPVLKRFVAEDPIGLSGGVNKYAYVNGNPVSLNDPSGLTPPTAVGAGIGTLILPGPGTVVGAVVGTVVGLGVGYLICKPAVESDEEKKKRNCQALKDSILATCASLTGRKKFACFAAAQESYQQCMSEQ